MAGPFAPDLLHPLVMAGRRTLRGDKQERNDCQKFCAHLIATAAPALRT